MKKSIKEAFETPTEWSFHWIQEKEEDEWVVGKENKGERKELSLLGFNVEGIASKFFSYVKLKEETFIELIFKNV